MVIKVYISGISASPEIKSYQQRAQFILDSLRVDYESVDITDPGHEDAKDLIREKCKKRNDQLPKTPQFFNDDTYCGDWFDFELASDEDRVLEWLGLDVPEQTEPEAIPEPITGTELESELPVAKEPEITRKETVTWDGNDKIVTEETVTKEEQIIFGNQVIRTAPEYVKVESDSNEDKHVIKDTIEIDTDNKEIEEETCLLDAPSAENSRSVTPADAKESDFSEPINSESYEKVDHDDLNENKSEATEDQNDAQDDELSRGGSALSDYQADVTSSDS